ncbi:restriction endonuclease subunit S [Faecalibacterium prausnitzii]|uniref:restriction endonuclease subunit S n=1 Tax=Faecalibacterium prausnitzii TaxID=853 RepID=UPI0029140BAB|nr:restriction endonuclease subunit S [Faecalibacterium prausnitzii]MDU8725719.1 restriction endonuclease subunit S [Faecalibacterium prausnitzii]
MTGQQLKNSILQMAVQGKLVPQDPNDEPASVLLERIRAEKEQLIKEGKIKKEKNPSVIFRGADNLPYEKIGKNEPVCIADEVPFDIPESWEWVRFKNLVSYNMGKTPPRKESEYWENATYPWVSIADLVLDDTVCVTKEHVNEHSAKVIFKNHISKAGTLLMSFKLTVGKVSILGMDAFHNEAIISIYPFCDVNRVITNYLFATLPLLSQNGNTKTAIKGATLNSDSLDALLIPVPPIKEQIRICEKIKALKNILSIYTNLEQSLTRLNDTFPLQLKKSILQYAVQGKLVPQDPADEPASVLLERIRTEKEQLVKEGKIKRDKHESVIFRRDNSYYEKVDGIERCIDDELPFEIPESWEWARIKSCMDVRDGTHDTPKYVEHGIPLITSKNLSNGYLDFSTAKFISIEDHLSIKQRSKVDDGDILFAMIGSIGNPVLYRGSQEFSIKNMALFKKISDEIIMDYVYIFLRYAQTYMKKDATGGVQAFVSLNYLRNYLIPVPPQNEQIRICNAIIKLCKKIDYIL